ncbi:MAG: hypothetical protein K0U65_01550 [Gammaproteobacteria bacterium]|nr:hypothetical protein [Gammaproteobacteria bacterium]
MKRSFSPTGAALLAASVLLAACNNDTGSTPLPGGEDEHDHDHGAESAGRLVFTHADGSNSRVYVHDLESRSTLADFALVHPATAVHSSPEHRYAVIVQRDNDQVEFLDGGVYRHDDHVDEGDPAMLPFTLSGVRPTHYRHHGEQAALFFDGDSASAALSQFHLFSDESLESGGTLAHQTLDTAHHGIAEPLDGVVLASHAAASGDAPDGISVFELHGDHFDNAKIAVAERLATVVGHPDVAEFAAFSYPGGNLYALDPEAGTATQVDWRDGAVDGDGDPVSALARGFDGHGEHLLVLDSNGDLHVLESSDWSHRGSIAVLDSVPASGPAPALAVSAAGDQAFVSDPAAPAIHIIDLEALSLEAVPLAFPPTGLAWTGVGEAHDHDGHDDHDHDH